MTACQRPCGRTAEMAAPFTFQPDPPSAAKNFNGETPLRRGMSIWISPGRGDVTVGCLGLLTTRKSARSLENDDVMCIGCHTESDGGTVGKRRTYGCTDLNLGMLASVRCTSSSTFFHLCSTAAPTALSSSPRGPIFGGSPCAEPLTCQHQQGSSAHIQYAAS
jgi:hypothetical protein